MAKILIKNLRKVFPNGYTAIDDVSLEIESGQFFVVLGPSGSGKTTLLRIIAGLETQTSGDILIDDQLVNQIAPKDRPIAMVFQNYALFPHLSVFDNMAFPLKMRGVPKCERIAMVNETAIMLKIENLLKRKPSELSGGQRQRVAIGRAIVKRPKIFLLDEPFSSLDVHLRKQMRQELKKIQKELGTTMIYVTHDQMDARVLGDKLCFMNMGKIEQLGHLEQMSLNPQNEHIAAFLGKI